MASLPRTIRVGIGSPGQTESYTLPPGLAQFVQSVYAEVDTSGSGDTTPSLSISEQAGVPIAVIPQGTPVAGGGSGRVTWALRLTDEPATGALVFLREIVLAVDTLAIDFTNIPQYFRVIRFVGEVRSPTNINMRVVLNNDNPDDGSESKYNDDEELVEWSNFGGVGTVQTQQTVDNPAFGVDTLYIAQEAFNAAETDAFSHFEFDFPYYAGTRYKSILGDVIGETQDVAGTPIFDASHLFGVYRDTAAIHRVRFYAGDLLSGPTMKAGSRVAMYGVR